MESKGIVKRDFKKGVSSEDGRRRREEKAISIRKEKKEEGLLKRRNIVDEENSQVEGHSAESQLVSVSTGVSLPSRPFVTSDIPMLMTGLRAADIETQTQSLRGFRKLLSSEHNPPVQQCVDCGAVPLFVQFLQRADCQALQFEAAWALTNIASTDRTRVVVESQALPYLVQLLQSPNPDIREQCSWCLGNIAGDGPDLRDLVLSFNALMPLAANVAQPANLGLLRNCTWALSNFCRGKPQPPLQVVAPALPILASIVLQNPDQDTVIDAIWALSYVSDGDNSRIQAVVDLGVVPSLVKMLTSNKNQLIVPALRTLGNIVSGNDVQTQSVLDAGALNALVPLLSNSKKNIRKEACWTLSNIAAGTPNQLTQLVSTPEIMPRILDQMSNSAEWDVRKEASWVISNIATGGQKTHISFLVESGAIRPLCDLLDVGEVKVVLLAIDSIDAILRLSDDIDRATHLVDEAGGIDKLELLQEHENEGVYTKAVALIEKYFGGEEEEESENLTPATATQSTFSFGMNGGGVDKTASGVAPAGFSFGAAPAATTFQFGTSSTPNAFQFGAMSTNNFTI